MTEKKKLHGNTSYKEVYNSIALNLCKLGAQDKDLADSFSVDVRTIDNWKVSYPEFFQSIKEGKTFYDTGLIENALKRKALGYEYEEVKEESEGDKVTKKTVTKKHLAPDTGAIALYLKNRASGDWKDKVEHTHIDSSTLADVVSSAADD